MLRKIVCIAAALVLLTIGGASATPGPNSGNGAYNPGGPGGLAVQSVSVVGNLHQINGDPLNPVFSDNTINPIYSGLVTVGAINNVGDYTGTTAELTGDIHALDAAITGAVTDASETSTGTISGAALSIAGGGVFGGVVTDTGETSSGPISGTTGTFSGALSATTGTFTGALSATTGSFSGAISDTGETSTGPISGTTGTFSGAVAGTTGTFSGALAATQVTLSIACITQTCATPPIVGSAGNDVVIESLANNTDDFALVDWANGGTPNNGLAAFILGVNLRAKIDNNGDYTGSLGKTQDLPFITGNSSGVNQIVSMTTGAKTGLAMIEEAATLPTGHFMDWCVTNCTNPIAFMSQGGDFAPRHPNQIAAGASANSCTIASGASTCSFDLTFPFNSRPLCFATQQNVPAAGTVTLQTVLPTCGAAETTSTTTLIQGAATVMTLVSAATFATGVQSLCVDSGANQECIAGTISGTSFTPSANWAHGHSGTYSVFGGHVTITLSGNDATNTSTYAAELRGNPN